MMINIVTGIAGFVAIVVLLSSGYDLVRMQPANDIPSILDMPVLALINPNHQCSGLEFLDSVN